MSLPDWARAYDVADLGSASIRNSPTDFDVTEELGYDFDGNGEHDYLFLEKIGTNTDWLARQLARFASVEARDVGYSGLKDRHAVTRQWFSVPRWHSPDWHLFDVNGVTVLDTHRHSRKLRRGAHRSNRFKIVLIKGSDPFSEARLQLIKDAGVPNYFGPQRFGRNAANLDLADAWSAGTRLPRHKRSLAISTARSYLFNDLLQGRVRNDTWHELLDGDVVNLDGTGSVFSIDAVDDELHQRCASMDIHPAGILWGDGADPGLVSDAHPNWLHALEKHRVKPSHRSLRLPVTNLQWFDDAATMTVEFVLGRGAFATSVLREMADVVDATAEGQR